MVDPHIAVVNSDMDLLTLLQSLLTEVGYEVSIYMTAPGTYQSLREIQPTLIILDVGLQASAAGWPLLKLLQFDPQTRDIPVLVTTVDHSFIRDKADLFAAMGCAVLELPARFETLIAKIKELTAQS